jgi:hypothetical protein
MPISLARQAPARPLDPAIGDPAEVLAFLFALDLDVRVRDPRGLAGITPAALEKYLSEHGWKREPVSSGEGESRLRFWERRLDDGSVSEVLVPASMEGRDYPHRVGDAVTEMSFALDRNKIEVLLGVRAAAGAANSPAAL